MKFAENLKYLRKTAEYTQKQLAEYLNLSANCICEWEKERSEPNLETIKNLAAIFGVSADYLLGLEDDFGVKKIAPATNTGNEGYSAEERQLIEIYRTLDDTMRETLWSLLNTWKPSYIPSIKKHSKQ